jgi:hypothetical protein
MGFWHEIRSCGIDWAALSSWVQAGATIIAVWVAARIPFWHSEKLAKKTQIERLALHWALALEALFALDEALKEFAEAIAAERLASNGELQLYSEVGGRLSAVFDAYKAADPYSVPEAKLVPFHFQTTNALRAVAALYERGQSFKSRLALGAITNPPDWEFLYAEAHVYLIAARDSEETFQKALRAAGGNPKDYLLDQPS